MAKAKAGQHRLGHLDIAEPAAPSRAMLTPPEGAMAFGQPRLGATPAPHVAWACQLFSFLDKATRTAPSQRSASHLAPYARDFTQWLEQYCEFFGPLTVQVRPYSLLLDGDIVFQDQGLDGVASRLCRDGIIALSWSLGITSEEILAWMQILLSVPQDDDEPDLVVKLWQAGLPHITVDHYDRAPPSGPEVQLERVQRTLTAFEAGMHEQVPDMERIAALAYAEDRALGQRLLTLYSHARAGEALELGRGLVAGIEAEVKARHGIPEPPPDADINAGGMAVSCLMGADPDRPRR